MIKEHYRIILILDYQYLFIIITLGGYCLTLCIIISGCTFTVSQFLMKQKFCFPGNPRDFFCMFLHFFYLLFVYDFLEICRQILAWIPG